MSRQSGDYVVREELPRNEALDGVSDSKAVIFRTKSLKKINEARFAVSSSINKTPYCRLQSSSNIGNSPSDTGSRQKLFQRNPRIYQEQRHLRNKPIRNTLQRVVEMEVTTNSNSDDMYLVDDDASQATTYVSADVSDNKKQLGKDDQSVTSIVNDGRPLLQLPILDPTDVHANSSSRSQTPTSSADSSKQTLQPVELQNTIPERTGDATNQIQTTGTMPVVGTNELSDTLQQNEMANSNLLPGCSSRLGTSTSVSHTGSPIQRSSRGEVILTLDDNFALLEEDEYVSGEDGEYKDLFREMQTRLEQTPRERLIGGMVLRVHPEAHEMIMGYKEREGPALKPFNSTNLTKSTGSEKQVGGKFPPRSSSLNISLATPAIGAQAKATPGSQVDRLNRPTAASSSRAAASSTRAVSGPGRLSAASTATELKSAAKKGFGLRARMSSYIGVKSKTSGTYVKLQDEKHDEKRKKLSDDEKTSNGSTANNLMLADFFNETKIGAFLDAEITHARANLENVQKAAVRIPDLAVRKTIIDTTAGHLRLLDSIIQIRQANIAANNATFALVRNLTTSASAASRQVLEALRQVPA